ncbi:MAG TPA: hypothetical protein VM900_05475 [Sphingomonas sp.]|nr:hypothetical protein [Sphingomonas sp.]
MLDRQLDRWALPVIILLGLALRIAAARGGLWLDEAWSAKLVHDAGTPLGVFLRINHDNNHHLNSLWMHVVGFGAPPMLVRLPAILCGTATIWVAARIAASRGLLASLLTATAFAISPVMVTYGSEARGYASMLLCLLFAILLVDRWLGDAPTASIRRHLAWCFTLGVLSQLTMLFACLALVGWVFFALCRRTSIVQALQQTARLFAPALLGVAAILAIIGGAAYASGTGFQFGGYQPFSIRMLLRGLIELVGFTIGLPVLSLWLLLVPLIALLLARSVLASRTIFYWIAILAFPTGIGLLHAANVGNARYFLLASVALLLMLAELASGALERHGWRRWLGGAMLLCFSVGALLGDADLVSDLRGDPSPAIRAMAAREPGGTAMLLDRETGRAMIEVGAAAAAYRLTIPDQDCPAPRFLFVDRFRGEDLPVAGTRCGRRYASILVGHARGMSGTNWALLELQR